ncbi:type II secretion system secretin GspD [Bdellovibrio bacteriovorus]|uniref:General secretion pathway protein D n=1 Tax=Bdellovibrio bacteriovorus (strain ATCC 15356 / DSM 50701 / NCIMB 9529 / HD100) TaxID=264462 RepID=Q6MMM9_BDEBA|nr:type II secretion system secretin GspD [Bdellovibrio bacteriovorus]AHZ84145.1 general secretion pathway protein GspD [Bdellovibrio bacteriovorus]BEV68028.1 Secretin ExeD [Bdellovibrio bacteriovorus]CAE79475.1 general secretion pathway protein D [Bdellovibrio bacteriovorus HD100]
MKKNVSIGLASLMTAQLVGPAAKAQFEDFPPPPPPPDFGDMGGGDSAPSDFGDSNSGGPTGMAPRGGSEAATGSSPLSKAEKDKFAKAPIEDINNKNFPETIESFDFPNVEISDIIRAISELTGKNFIIDPGVRGKITIIAPTKITVSEAYKAFLSALAINGFTVVPSGSFLKVKSARNAQRDNIETFSGAYYPNADQMITRIIHLKHISASQVNRDLRILPSKDGEMNIYEPTNSIIISDYGSNIDRVMKIISQLDVPGFEEQLEVIPVKYAKSKDLADLVDKIVNKGNKTQGSAPGTFTAGVPRFSRSAGATSQQGASFFMAIPDDRTNSIIVVGNKSGIVRIKKLISQLDFKIRAEESGGVYVYNVRHGDAEKIAQTLQGVTKDAAPKPATGGSLLSPLGSQGMQAPQEIFGGDVKITADKTTNSLIVTASKQDYDVVLNILSKIDTPRDQVFVEAIIMEMSVNDGNSWGIGYYQYGDSGYGKVGFNGLSNINDFLSPTGGSGAVIGFGQGKTVEVTDPVSKTTLKIPSLLGFINFLKTAKKANILSTPQLMTLDNQEGELEVGDKVVVGENVQNVGTSGTTVRTPQFEDATIKLAIKPFISPASNQIRMEIKQQVAQLSTASTPKAFQDSTQPLAKRSLKTVINVNNGDTVVLGGLMKEQDQESVTKVPLLGDIPIIGWLFKSRTIVKDKTNMVVFLTPKIVRNNIEANAIVSKKLDERVDFVKAQGGVDPYGAKLDEIRRKAEAPSAADVPATAEPIIEE